MKMLKLSLMLTISMFYSGHVFSSESFKLASYNIRNFDYDTRSHTPTNKKHLVHTINEIQADLMAVQEINEREIFIEMIESNYKREYSTVLSKCGGAHDQRLGFIFKTKKVKLISFHEDYRTVTPGKGRVITSNNCRYGSRPLAIAKFKKLDSGEIFYAIAVHLKSGGQPKSITTRFKQLKVLNKVTSELKQSGVSNIVIMGDFNSTEYSLKNENYRRFKREVSKMDLIDTTGDLACSSYWWGGVDDYQQYPSTLDHILVSSDFLNKRQFQSQNMAHCKQLKCQPTLELDMGVSFDEVSDHCPVMAEIK